jgi:histidinol-phosphatase (PHP family)
MDPYDGIYFSQFTPSEGLTRYFDTILNNLKTFPQFQSVGHLDYVARYLPTPRPDFRYGDYQDVLDAILTTVIDAGKGIEVNTSGLKSGLPWPNPHMDILKRYRELGGEIITIGSDAHQPEHMAYAYDQLPGILTTAGFRYYTLYREKKPEFIPIEA